MNLGWKGLIPLSILNVIVTGFGLLYDIKWASWAVVLVTIAISVTLASRKTGKVMQASQA